MSTTRTPPPLRAPPGTPGWAAALTRQAATSPPSVSGAYGIAVADSAGTHPVSLGPLRTGAAWSTMKVPVALAALGNPTPSTSRDVRAALEWSDNAAAGRLWDSLGSGRTAAGRVDVVLARYRSSTHTQALVTRAGFSAFGQTQWPLADQVTFTASLGCTPGSGPSLVHEHLGSVSAGQRWAAGRWHGALFKAGWGPGVDGTYLVRQLALLPNRGGWTAVTLAARARSGSFQGAIADLDSLERWLRQREDMLPVLRCGQ